SQCTTTSIMSSKHTCIKPWMTTSILKCVREKEKLRAKYNSNPSNPRFKTNYMRCHKKLRSLIKNAKKLYLENKIANNAGNIKKQFDVIKDFLHLPKKENFSLNAFPNCSTVEIAIIALIT